MVNAIYRNGVGRLVTDRYDFQNHIDGYSLGHNANSISLSPNLTINSVLCTNAQSAFTTITNYINTFTYPDATSSVKGVVKLAGDLAGLSSSAAAPKVSGLQGKPISTAAPSSGNVLTWNTLGYWEPAIIPAKYQFVAGGDLDGYNTNQEVIDITGKFDALFGTTRTLVKCNLIVFNESLTYPLISQMPKTSGVGKDLVIMSQPSLNDMGGGLELRSGSSDTGFRKPPISLVMGVSETLVETAEPVLGQSVVSLVRGSPISSTQMPSGTGDKVIYIGNADTAPVNPPVGGSILYSNGGGLYVKESTGTNFKINNNNAIIFYDHATKPMGYGLVTPGVWTSFFNTSSTTYVEAFPEPSYYQSAIGDIIKVYFSGLVSGDGYVNLMVTGQADPTLYPIVGTEIYFNEVNPMPISLVGMYTVTNPDNAYVLVGLKAVSPNSVYIYGGATIMIEVIRPTPQ